MTPSLDSTTPRGVPFIARQHAILDELARVWRVDVARTADGTPANVDAVIARDGQLLAVLEIKARDCTLVMLREFGSYLVTFDKLIAGRMVAARLRVGFALVVGLLDAVVWFPIADGKGDWIVRLSIARTTTQRTCNGGSAERANAYLDLRDMRVVSGGDW